ncbi:oligosaccharide flippase family protein [Conchiformibius steedae DSM 2580]|uniref:Oligosaccharide flippase family protein n=1 Tax=Conchiformibius steedae DSM 2580 TaxID=1121352 RepID=A0AAE9HSB7_9NEIS|nr:oligosaccharide flippase family protein [Conchiformibius steedae]QMT34403.1 oligosaccharide flippase family protein [Conchiformibius steedae]URD67182.1 oligosaccharide flippase family protein [Conchiformibius steedae DSM 2580]
MKILKDSAIYLFGEMFAKALPFLLLPYLTRKLGAAGFGELSYYQTFSALLVILFGLSQDGAVARYYYVYGKRNLHNVVYAGYAYTFTVAAIALAVAWAAGSLIMAAVVASAAVQCILNVQLTLRQCRKQAVAYTVLQIASGLLCSLLTILLLEWTDGEPVFKRFAALLLGNTAVSAIAAWWFFRQQNNPIRWSWYRIKHSLMYVAAFGLPLFLHHGAGFVKGQLDRMVLYPLYPAEQLGVYAAGFQVAMVLGILLMAVNKATVPYYYQAMKSGRLNAEKVRRLAWFSLPVMAIPALLALLIPEAWFLWLLGEQYGGVKWYICLFLIGCGLSAPYYLLVNYLFYRAWNSRISALSLLSAAIYLGVLAATAPLGPQWTPFAMIAGAAVILPLLYRQVKD